MPSGMSRTASSGSVVESPRLRKKTSSSFAIKPLLLTAHLVRELESSATPFRPSTVKFVSTEVQPDWLASSCSDSPKDHSTERTMEGRAGQSAKLFSIPRGQVPIPHRRSLLLVAFYTVAALWIPCAVLALFQGGEALRWFIGDYAAQSRILFFTPLMILGTPLLGKQLVKIANQFITARIVDESGRRVVQQERAALEQERESPRVRWLLVAISLAIPLAVADAVQHSGVLLPWGYRGAGRLSAAGWFYLLVVFPCIEFLFLRWLWKQWQWLRFLRRVARLKLRLIASHPDNVGGLGFLQWAEWEYAPACLAVGTLFAGGIGNRIAYSDAPLFAYKYALIMPVVSMLLICVGPLWVFQRKLLRAKQEGVFAYGRIAVAVGRLFEDKWLPEDTPWNHHALGAHDIVGAKYFSSIVGNVYKMRLIPIGSAMVIRLIVWTLLPMLPVAIAAIGVDVLFRQALKLLL